VSGAIMLSMIAISFERRVKWLRRGLETGDPADCDTFGAPRAGLNKGPEE